MNFIDRVSAAELSSATTTAEESILSSFGINLPGLLWSVVNFTLIVIIVWFLILRPLTKKMAERQKLIDNSLENAKKIEQTVKRSEEKYQEHIDKAKVEANKILEKAVINAQEVDKSLKEKTHQEIKALTGKAKATIQAEKEQMIVDLKKDTADLIVVAMEKVLTEKIDSEKDKTLINDFLKKLPKDI